MRPFSFGSRQFAGALTVVAIVVLIASLAVAWYQLSTSTSGTYSYSATTTLYLGSQYQQTASTSTSFGSSGGTSTLPYAGHLNATGSLYGAAQILIVIALLAAIGGVLGLFLGRRRGIGWDRSALILIILALLLTILVPILIASDQSSAFASDLGSSYSGASPNPTNSFFGSCSVSACGSAGASGSASISWGPSTGWFLVWVAMGLLLVSLYVLWGGRSDRSHFLLRSSRAPRTSLSRGWRPPPEAKSREAMHTPPALQDLPERPASWDESPPKWQKPPE